MSLSEPNEDICHCVVVQIALMPKGQAADIVNEIDHIDPNDDGWERIMTVSVGLTSFPMQRWSPTPFSHLWWMLILQALQRRPCFAVFPARNTTCLAVVPVRENTGTHTHGCAHTQKHKTSVDLV